MRTEFKIYFLALWLVLLTTSYRCQKSPGNGDPDPDPPTPVTSQVDFWLTSSNGSTLLARQNISLAFDTRTNNFPNIDVDSSTRYQQIEGFGYTLTGGSADLIYPLDNATRSSLLRELFTREGQGIGISYLRLSIGASDLSASVFSYNDLPQGETDTAMIKFSLGADTVNLVPLLKEILQLSPDIKILGSPWSAPVWMKSNGHSVGGTLLPQYYPAYAKYFVKYLKAMEMEGITVHAVTVQNEPLHDGNNPSMYMSAADQTIFVRDHLGPALRDAGLQTEIIIWDHNCDNPGYPLQVLSDPLAKSFIAGSAFHLYNGDISALSQVHNAHPDRAVYFTEQYTPSNGNFGGDLRWHLKNVIIGSMRNWSLNALAWNLANDAGFGPHTPGGCTVCKGALTISGGITRNVAYYIIAHASRFVVPGSVRIASEIQGNLHNVAFQRPDGKKVLIVLNDGSQSQPFNIKFKDKWVTTALDAGAVGTFVW